MPFVKTPLALGLALSLTTPALAEETASETLLPGITISATPLGQDADELTHPVSVIEDAALFERAQSTLGNALSSQPGVHADTFGGGASRPVIRGQGAPRVRVLSDGSSLLDASEVSPDHASTVEPLLATRIEVLRGPAALLYGGGAIAGVVNVLDNKIPTTMPHKGLEGFVGARANSVADEKAAAFGLSAAASRNIAVHVEGTRREADDYTVPDWSERRVDGSYAESGSGSLGLSWIGERGFLGAAYSYRRDQYGLPGHSHGTDSCHIHDLSLHCEAHEEDEEEHDHAAHEGLPYVKLRSARLDLRGELLAPVQGIDRIRLRAGYTEYRHHELEHGEIATTFRNRGHDSRLEVEHAPIADWRGVVGLQHAQNRFGAEGEEAFLPTTATRNTGLFLLEQYEWQDWHFELGGRQEWQSVEPDTAQPRSSLNASSFSAAAHWHFHPDYRAGLALSRAQRLPTAQELYANGVHLATNTYELGDPQLGRETTNNVELSLRKTEGDATFALSVYQNHIDRYTYAQTLDQFEAFRLVRYTQRDAEFRGAEAEASYRVTPLFSGTVFGDYVQGRLRKGDELPRIPAARLGARGRAERGGLAGELEYFHAFEQRDIADFETRTPGYDMVNASLSYQQGLSGGQAYQVFLRGENLLDKLALNHASFLTHSAPLPGRNISMGVKLSF